MVACMSLSEVDAKQYLVDRVKQDVKGCWIWQRSLTAGYAQIRLNGFLVGHRLAYELYVGTIPAGLEIDHLCRIRACINPDHLEAVTSKENIRRMVLFREDVRKSNCIYGHKLIIRNDRDKRQRCQTCEKLNHRRHFYGIKAWRGWALYTSLSRIVYNQD